ncbi:TetR/AcrR family transcriptional regulator, fatty acid metabolism regulator protein [Salinibacillus kushneri]|uniref:TetR/AcrR family transcriptional regulator, fatty acid metabolism regulator protein n=1 Tax=Salinibacillus kushneri TaxID=237682 RepID=A0A1I0H361_9BACI|nr:TetR/AcrR family transcriptional regulator [Salinibacillus kushneri]SET77989.1 TetR/AcrR family transcriptional regulator, fatty acid metabolism regulator protein [Salinibacillus kushneri]
MKKNKPKYKQIIDAAVEVIAENGYHASQVSKIAKKAGVADGTIYLYFRNKEDILVSLFQEKMGNFIEKIKEDTEKKTSADEKLRTLIEMHFSRLASNHHLAVVTQLELRQSNKDLRLKINDVLKGYLEIIDDILNEGIEEGLFHPELNIKLVRQMIFGTLDEVVTNWVMKEEKYDLISQTNDVHYLITNGLKK